MCTTPSRGKNRYSSVIIITRLGSGPHPICVPHLVVVPPFHKSTTATVVISPLDDGALENLAFDPNRGDLACAVAASAADNTDTGPAKTTVGPPTSTRVVFPRMATAGISVPSGAMMMFSVCFSWVSGGVSVSVDIGSSI